MELFLIIMFSFPFLYYIISASFCLHISNGFILAFSDMYLMGFINNIKDKVPSREFVSSNIDILRGIAILLVVLVHTSNMLSLMGLVPKTSSNPEGFYILTVLMSFGASGVGLLLFICLLILTMARLKFSKQ